MAKQPRNPFDQFMAECDKFSAPFKLVLRLARYFRNHPPPKVPTRYKPNQKKDRVSYHFLRNLGAASLFLGAASFMIGISFVWAATCLILGLVLWAADVWLDPNAPHNYKLTISAIAFVLIASFVRFVIFVPAPLKIDFTGDPGDYPNGEKIGTLTWDCPEQCTDFRITVTNPTNLDYADVDVELITDLIVLREGQVVGPPCWFLPVGDKLIDFRWYDVDKQEHLGESFHTGTRFRCHDVPKHTAIQIVLGMATPSPSDRPNGPKKLPSRVDLLANYVVLLNPREKRVTQNPIEYLLKQPWNPK